MRIVGLDITGFGPLTAKKLAFVDGMNVLHGPNESAKTAIHAAIFAGLCGIRRGQGQPKKEDKGFDIRHRPWDGRPWEVSALVRLGDGRTIRLTHDLAGKVGSNAVDASNGNDVSSEIQFDGSIDGSVWLGLNRRAFRATACVRQAEIVAALADDDDHREDHNALQQALQRAATSAGQRDETASSALKALNEFWRENVGQDDGRSAKRPYRHWKGEVAERKTALQVAQDAHARYLDLLAERDRAIADRERRQRAVRLAEAVIAHAKAAAVEVRASRAGELQERQPVEPGGASADRTLADQVSEALTLWDTAPPSQVLSGTSSGELDEELAELPERPDGELTPAQEVIDAVGDLAVARKLVAQQGEVKPRAVPPSVEVSVPASPEIALHSWTRARVPMIAVAFLAAAGIAAIALGASAVGAALLVGAVAAAAAAFWFLRPPTASPSAEAVSAPTSQVDGAAAWETQREELGRQVEETQHELVAALLRHGVTPADDETAEAASERYKADCGDREAQDRKARRRDELKLMIEQRKRAEERHAARDAAISALRSAAASAGVAETDPAALAAALRTWQGERHLELETHDEEQRDWAELEQLLAGATLADLKEQARRERDAAAAATTGFLDDELDGLDSKAVEGELPTLRYEHQQAAEDAAARAQLAASEGAKLRSVAEVEAELAEANEKLARVVALDETLRQTIEFLAEAQQRVYETIAPILTKTLKHWLPRVAVFLNSGDPEPRYNDVYVDPQTLAVRVRLDDGPWCEADLLSAGTREQIYLLLRVALAEHLVKDGEVVPLLLDEVTAQCDSTRRTALLNLLLELSTERQIVLFTHDDAVYQWAKAILPTDAVQTMKPIAMAQTAVPSIVESILPA